MHNYATLIPLDKISRGKVEKVQKAHQLCIIMLITPSLYNFLEKSIFGFQIIMDKVHPAQISSPSDNCITDIMKNYEKSLKNRCLVPTIQAEPDYS